MKTRWWKKSICLFLGLCMAVSSLSGCGGSIIRNASLDYTLDMVQPLSANPKVSEDAALTAKAEQDLKKYQVEGNDAFYI